MLESLVIRKAEVQDASQIKEIYDYYVLNSAVTFETEAPSLDEMVSRIENVLEKYPYIVATIDNKVVGFTYATPLRNRRAYDISCETTIYIDKDYLNLKIGDKLYTYIFDILRRQNILNIYVCITDSNEGSILFHEKFGFEVVGRFEKSGYKLNNYHGVVWMERVIGQHSSKPKPLISYKELI